MRILNSLILVLVFAAQTSFAIRKDNCHSELAGNGIHINIEIQFDPDTGQPVARIVNQTPPAPRLDSAEERRPRPRAQSYRRQEYASVKEAYRALALRGRLINQSDYRLGLRGLLIPNGGLCSSACGTNVLHAFLEFAGREDGFRAESDYYVHRIVDFAWDRFGVDARKGLDIMQLADALVFIGKELDLNLEVQKFYGDQRGAIRIDELVPDENELIIASIYSDFKDDTHFYHAIVIVDADTRRERVIYSDPNNPNNLERSWTEPRDDRDGNESLRLDYRVLNSNRYTGVISRLIRVRLKH